MCMIKNSEDANRYYNLVNQYIDEYLDTWKIKPTNLKNYLLGNKSKMLGFLERKGLKEVASIDIVIKDVIEDRVAMFKDTIMTFENYKVFESEDHKILESKHCLWKGLAKSDMEHEKILADAFDVSLSQVDCVDSSKHIFEIDDVNQRLICVIFTEPELLIIKENIKEYTYNQMCEQVTKVSGLDVDFKLAHFIDIEKFNSYCENVVSNLLIEEFICNTLNCEKFTKELFMSNCFIGVLK
jgi:hypothetical protein